jgi:hypothetical protein
MTIDEEAIKIAVNAYWERHPDPHGQYSQIECMSRAVEAYEQAKMPAIAESNPVFGLPNSPDIGEYLDALCNDDKKPVDGDAFDYARVRDWARSEPRKPANLAFTASTNRNVAYLIEDLDALRKAKNMGESPLDTGAESRGDEGVATPSPATAPPGAKHCLHYNMTLNYRCNDCGHALSEEEREDYPYGNDE